MCVRGKGKGVVGGRATQPRRAPPRKPGRPKPTVSFACDKRKVLQHNTEIDRGWLHQASSTARVLEIRHSRRSSPARLFPSRLIDMIPLHQMPAANPRPEQLYKSQVKTIQTKVNNKKLDPAVPVRTNTPSRALPWPRPSRAARTPASPQTIWLIAANPFVQMSVPQSEPAGREQMASVQQARRLGPP